MVIKCEQLKGNKSRQMCGCWNGNWQMSRELQHIASQDCKYVKVGVKDAFLGEGEASDMKWNGRMDGSSSSGPPDNEPQQATNSEFRDSGQPQLPEQQYHSLHSSLSLSQYKWNQFRKQEIMDVLLLWGFKDSGEIKIGVRLNIFSFNIGDRTLQEFGHWLEQHCLTGSSLLAISLMASYAGGVIFLKRCWTRVRIGNHWLMRA